MKNRHRKRRIYARVAKRFASINRFNANGSTANMNRFNEIIESARFKKLFQKEINQK